MKNFLKTVVAILLVATANVRIHLAQDKTTPVTKAEILAFLKQAPEKRSSQGDLAEEIDTRGLGFKLDDATIEQFRAAGAKAFLIDAIRRRSAPMPSAAPTAGATTTSSGDTPTSAGSAARPLEQPREAPAAPREMTPEEKAAALARLPLIEQARWHALEYVEELPNFSVTQMVSRYEKLPQDKDWRLLDKLEVELTYREKEGEKFKLLKVNGAAAKTTYEQLGGSTSTGEFGLLLSALFLPVSHAEFKELRSETYGRFKTVVFDFRVKKVDSVSYITDKGTGQKVIAGYSGSVWVDTESKKVVRVELAHEQIPASFPVSLAENSVDYDWVEIAGERYLLPVRAEVLLGRDRERMYARNVIELKNYHKFDTDVQILPAKDPF